MIEESHLKIIQDILKKYLPLNTILWVFGSRANGKARRFSDLDLLFDCGGKPLPDHIKLTIIEAFDNSALPYKVDLVDLNTISEAFKKNIQPVIFEYS